ncbi:MAG: TetR/AcrR family transcriptional regulator [Betaproteobacteria bacterium]|nr:TetR/AcrR family transcriptional regulator [Betaproteobacteria bacterium]
MNTVKAPAKTAKKTTSSSSPPIDDIRDAVTKLKRERIISTALELFNQNGLTNTTLDAVAEQMNVTKPFIYTHFKSKNELLSEICSRGIRASLDVLDRVVASKDSPTVKLRVLAHDFMMAVIENQSHIAIYTREEKHLSPESSKAIQKMRREFDRKFCALLEQGVKDGEFQVDDVQLTALAIGGIVGWAPVWFRANGRLSLEEVVSYMASMVLAMVRAKKSRKTKSNK